MCDDRLTGGAGVLAGAVSSVIVVITAEDCLRRSSGEAGRAVTSVDTGMGCWLEVDLGGRPGAEDRTRSLGTLEADGSQHLWPMWLRWVCRALRGL